ncbi:hypothetical protein ACWCYY_19290 [Kitasatospora sp. NPDC001664]
MDFARQWSKLPATHFKVAMGALEREMQREHLERMRAMELGDLESKDKRRARLDATGLVIGGLLSLGFLGLTAWLAKSQPVIAGITGAGGAVTLVLLVKMFVLRQAPSDADMKALTMQQKLMANLAGQQSPAPAPAAVPAPADPAPATTQP